jgi:hypothetical protein
MLLLLPLLVAVVVLRWLRLTELLSDAVPVPLYDLDTLGDLDRETVTSSPLAFDVKLLLPAAFPFVFGTGGEGLTVSRLEPSGKLAIFASSSCSCWRALTNAALSLLVCSCFKAFLTLLVTHCSQITRTSLPEIKDSDYKI